MNQSLPQVIDGWRDSLGGTAFAAILGIFGIFIFVVWFMWLIFPLVMYYQLRSVQDRLAQLHGDLVEVNLRLTGGGPGSSPNQIEGNHQSQNPLRR